jgi:hypothetical protein
MPMIADRLLGLADYLDKLPPDYEKFTMSTYARCLGGGTASVEEATDSCFTCACALGHGPAAGYAPLPDDISPMTGKIYWESYASDVFGVDSEDDKALWSYMFASEWAFIDDTPQGAAKRIRYAVEHGVPNDFDPDEETTWHMPQ